MFESLNRIFAANVMVDTWQSESRVILTEINVKSVINCAKFTHLFCVFELFILWHNIAARIRADNAVDQKLFFSPCICSLPPTTALKPMHLQAL